MAQEVLSPQPGTVESYGRVLAMSRVGNTLYIGGNFSLVGPSTGQGAPVSLDEGKPLGNYPRVAGIVRAASADGHGGWFIGGEFSGVGGLPRRNLAHILADGSVSSWAPDPDAVVRTLVLREERLYVGGDFTTIAGVARREVAAFEIPGGRITRWNPDAVSSIYGGVYTMVVHGHSVYLGGAFASVGGQGRNFLAEVDSRTGRVSDWNPGASGEVRALAVHGNTIYVGGYFQKIGGEDHPLLVALDRATGSPMPRVWRLERIPDRYRFDNGPYVGVLVVHGRRLYIGGSFTHVDSIPRGGVAAIDLGTQDLTDWDAHLVNAAAPSPYCYALAIHDGVVYIGGWFLRVGPVDQRLYAAAVDEAQGELLSWYPKPNAEVRTLALGERAIYAGGDFSSLWSWGARNNLAALDTRTGELLPWNPNPNSLVDHMLVSSNTMYVSGAFSQVGGCARAQIAALDLANGAPTAWNPGVMGYGSKSVWSLVMARGTLYVGGWFYGVGGQPRGNLAAIDSATGTVTDWNPGAEFIVSALALRGDTLYAGGWFEEIGGVRRHLLAALDINSGSVLPWQAEPTGHIETLAVGDRALYVGGTLQSVDGIPRDGLAALDLRTGYVLPWRADAHDRVLTLAVSHGVVYAGGWFKSAGGLERHGAAAIDSETGEVLPWDPQARAEYPADPVIWTLLPWEDTIYPLCQHG